jgi:hypothetical protein
VDTELKQTSEESNVTVLKGTNESTSTAMGAFRAHDPTQGSGVFLVEVVRLIDGVCCIDRRSLLDSVEVFVLGEDGSERTLVLPHAPGQLRGVPVEILAERLGCSPAQIEQV